MRSLFIKSIIAFLIFFGKESYAQYNYKQIDSIFISAKRESDQNTDFKKVVIAYNASKKINYEPGIAKAFILYTDSCYNAGKYDKAFKYVTQAENASSSINDWVLIVKIKVLKGLCYNRLGFYKEADQTLTSAIPIAKNILNEEDRHYFLMVIYTDLAVSYDSMGNKNSKKIWGNNSYSESQFLQNSNKYVSDAAVSASNRANRFTLLKQFDSAAFYVNKSLLLVNRCTDQYKYKKNYAFWVTYYHAGNFYYAKKEYSMSASYYKKALNAVTLVKYTIGLKNCYTGLANTYIALNMPHKALEYDELSNKLGDSLAQAEKASIRTPLNYLINSKEQQLKTNRNRYFQIISGVFFLLLITFSVMFFYRHKLKKEIKLSAEKMNELIKKIELNKENQSPSKIEELKEVVQLAINNDPAFFMKFNEFDAEFSKKLIKLGPSLIATDIEFCALLRLNFGTKEIARYTRVSVRAVEGKKYRIRKKLGLPTEQDLNLWMSQV